MRGFLATLPRQAAAGVMVVVGSCVERREVHPRLTATKNGVVPYRRISNLIVRHKLQRIVSWHGREEQSMMSSKG